MEQVHAPAMEFVSDADANKYARYALGHSCCAVALTDSEVEERVNMERRF
jgi:hypothetical protein